MMRRFYKLPDFVQHSLFAALLMWVVALPLLLLGGGWIAVVAGWALGVGFYWGREHRDAEIKNPTLYDKIRGLNPFKWPPDSQSDFFWPFGTNTALAAVALWLIS